MQVGIQSKTGSVLTPSPLQGGGVTRYGNIGPSSTTPNRPSTDFPDSPLISSRPVRYNVQLNEQITTVQRADSYLRQTENQLLQLRKAVGRGVEMTTLAQKADNVSLLLEQRIVLSGNTVDRQLQVSLENKTQVSFALEDAQSMLQRQEGETLIFSLGGNKRELVAVRIELNSSPEQTVRRLNQGLGRWGIHGKLDAQGQVNFRVAEKQWARVSTQLSVRGEGHRYPADQFYPVKLIAESDIADRVKEIAIQSRRVKNNQIELDRILEQVTQQRRRLTHSKERVRQRIDGMATFSEPGSAQAAAHQLAQKLGSAGQDYAALDRALSAQANVRPLTVKNLLT